MSDRLHAAAGPAGVLERDAWTHYAVAGVEPRAVVAPASVEAAAAVLALCSEEGWPVEPAGAGSWLASGHPPAVPPVVVSTARLRRVREYEPADLVVGVEAGLSLAELQDVLAAHRQTVPLDPPADRGATIGAAASLASSGPLRAGHGAPRDMILGAQIVTGDGRVLHLGGRVVKNVAGYDLVRLLIGSRGSLGLITAVFVRLRGLPDRDATFQISADTAAAAALIARSVRTRMDPDAIELLSPQLAGDVLHAGSATAWTVLVRLRGSEAAVAEASDRLDSIGSSTRPLSATDAASVWGRLSASEAGASMCVRVSDLPARLDATLASALRLTGRNSASGSEMSGKQAWRIAAHGADGIVRIWAGPEADATAGAALASELPPVTAELASGSGTVTWPILPAAVAALFPPAATRSRAEARIAADLKARFDPAGILSPGRHLVGL